MKKKTDLDKFKELYKSLDIELIVEEKEEVLLVKMSRTVIGTDFTYSTKFKGCSGFYSDIQFTKEGEFIDQGFWSI